MGTGFRELRDRAYEFLAACETAVAEEELLAHVYGGLPPAGVRAQLSGPLLGDHRLTRLPDGHWSVARMSRSIEQGGLEKLQLTALALAATGPTPGRGRVVRVAALHLENQRVVERFEVTLNPGKRVPRYVGDRLGLAFELLDGQPPFEAVVDDLAQFFGSRPVVAQDARLSWAFLDAEARRVGRVFVEPRLIDVNQLAMELLELKGKPSLALVAAQLDIGTINVARPEEEARVLAAVVGRLLEMANQRGASVPELHGSALAHARRLALRESQTARALPDVPGVYVLRDDDLTPLYVGKARRLRSRVSDYVHRPLGATRRLEGLVEAVQSVDRTLCANDLEALVLEGREIRRLRPRFNTVHQQRPPRLWIRLPPVPEQRAGKRPPAPRRLVPSLGPAVDDGQFVGPFRNESAADSARSLARAIFELDALRRGNSPVYEDRLAAAWAFLNGERALAESHARRLSLPLLRAVLAFDVAAMLLPADPREARYALVRPGPSGLEGFLIDRGICRAWTRSDDDDVGRLALDLLEDRIDSRTGPEDADVVLRWLGAQRAPTRVVWLPDDPLAATDAIEAAALSALMGEARPSDLEDSL